LFCLSKYFLRLYSFQGSDQNKEQQQPPPFPPPMNPRIILTVFILSMFLAYINASQEKQRDANGLSHGYISWNEFVQDMLSKGEVSLIYYQKK